METMYSNIGSKDNPPSTISRFHDNFTTIFLNKSEIFRPNLPSKKKKKRKEKKQKKEKKKKKEEKFPTTEAI